MDSVEAALAKIDERDAEIQAWSYVARDESLRAAQTAQGPLAGVPFGVKDIVDVAGMPTEWGTPVQKGRVPDKDAKLVARLKQLGAVPVGKTHTTAFAYFDPAPTRNPHSLEHTPGGSSSGSAAAVAAGMALFALGSQTQGSVLRPASFCGVVGWKPTYGLLPLEGVMPFAPSLDHAGILARSVEDVQKVWNALHGATEAALPTTVTELSWPIEGELDRDMASAFEEAVASLIGGFRVVEAPAPKSFQALPGATATIMPFEAAEIHGPMLDKHGTAIGEKLAAHLEKGRRISEAEYQEAKEAVYVAKREFRALSKEHPLIVTASAVGTAPKGLESTGDPRCNVPWTTLGAPAISIPMRVDGLPLGLQLSAGYNEDAALLQAAGAAVELIG